MRLDYDGLIIMEQTTFPGSVGDSCAETSRYVTLSYLIGKPVTPNLKMLITPQGVVRYPISPWGPSDTSADQVLPLLAACSLVNETLADQVITQIVANGYRTGNSEMIPPTLYAQAKRCQSSILQPIWDLAIVGQALLFKSPIRWNDQTAWFTTSAGSTADYLNFINFLAFARQKKWTIPCWLATKIVSQSEALAAVQSYYQPEPNVQWLLDIYQAALPKIW